MRANRDVIVFSALAAVESCGLLGNAAPSRVEIERSGADPLFRRELREAYVASGLLGVGLGAALAYLSESWWPLAFAFVGAGGWITLCESALPPEARLSPLQLFRPTPQLRLIRGGAA